jgi:serine/threonine protein kinase
MFGDRASILLRWDDQAFAQVRISHGPGFWSQGSHMPDPDHHDVMIDAGPPDPEPTMAGPDPDGRPGALEATCAGEGDLGGDRRGSTPAARTIAGGPTDPGLTQAGEGARPRPELPIVPGFEILGELGRGGMGVVYLAREVRLNRPCALKMILAGEHASPDAAVRFLAEAETVARLRHPHVVQVYSLGDHGGCPYFELEYVEGGSLALALDGTPWAPGRAARLVEALAGAVAEAHRLGIVHRDIKPGNVLLTADGTPELTDFGLAKSLGVTSSLTQSGAILGSPSYMAPEQAEGHTKDVGPAADVYALGVVLYELLTGRPPFRATSVLETLQLVKSAEPLPPSRLVPGLPRDVERSA